MLVVKDVKDGGELEGFIKQRNSKMYSKSNIYFFFSLFSSCVAQIS